MVFPWRNCWRSSFFSCFGPCISKWHNISFSAVPTVAKLLHSLRQLLLVSVWQMFFQTLKKKVLSGVGQIVLIHYLVIFLCLIQNYLIVKKLNCLLMFLLRLLRILFWYKLLIVFQRRMQEAYQDEIFQLWCAVFNVSARQMQLMGLLQKLVIQHNITGGWIVMKLKRFMCSQAEII